MSERVQGNIPPVLSSGRFRRSICGLLALAGFSASAPLARAAGFTVVDGRSAQEVSETSRLYLDGRLVATFRLGPDRDEDVQQISLPSGSGPDYHYSLCGEITIRKPGGSGTETHVVSSSGILHAPEGHVFDAYGDAGFTDFFLLDPDSPQTTEHRPGKPGMCDSPIS
ncbi:hypothetical protein LOC54_07515 [Acetobacter sp. AN02]|uniref:hypothetical protein n=1 Tax=Acetobacter sp. AN02 TaxID=2894186 RepID=UPI0024341CBD|nr:hypothetical protein [Acetobacter sp. AN02]MDG6094958.1 hypothetical protein [Acetobacter sp. AN02]